MHFPVGHRHAVDKADTSQTDEVFGACVGNSLIHKANSLVG